MLILDVVIQPHSNLHFMRIVQEGEGQCSSNGTKEFREGKKKEHNGLNDQQ